MSKINVLCTHVEMLKVNSDDPNVHHFCSSVLLLSGL